MLTKPDLKDEKIIRCLQDAYGIDVATLTFLPLGADVNTAVYRLTSSSHTDYFLKLRSGEFLEASVAVPQHLADLGIKPVIPPLATKTGPLWTCLASFKAILYPYIQGRQAVETLLSTEQWTQFGAAIKKLHSVDIPASITKDVPRETFSSKWRDIVTSWLMRLPQEAFHDPISAALASLLISQSDTILTMIKGAAQLEITIQQQPLDYVLCHADLHGWNLMVDHKEDMFIVDWDTLIFALKERDLMFVGAGIWNSGLTAAQEESLFYQGYGDATIHHDALTYYRLERIIQDIGDYCEYIFRSEAGGDDRMQSLAYLQAHFVPGGTVERAYHSYNTRKM